MGRRFVATDKFQTARQQGKVLTMEAKAIHPATKWAPEDRSMVSVHPPFGEQVTIRVTKCDAQTGVRLYSRAGFARLSIKTICDADTIRAEILQ
jgi:hypothetical protein